MRPPPGGTPNAQRLGKIAIINTVVLFSETMQVTHIDIAECL